MKKINTSYIFALLVFALLFLSFGCNKDDNNNPTGGTGTGTGLAGTWNVNEITVNPGTDSAQVFNQAALQVVGLSLSLVANENGTYTITTTTTADGTTTESGTWAINGSDLTITPEGDSPITIPFTLDNNTLTLTVEDLEFGDDIFRAILKLVRQ